MNNPNSITGSIKKAKLDNIKSYFITGFIGLILIGAAYTGFHSYSLFYRGLGSGPTAALLAAVPVLLLEGVVLLTLGANFFYFSSAEQKTFGGIGGWVGITILAINTIIDHNLNTSTELPYALTVYAYLMLPALPVASLAFIKHLLALDPSIKEIEENALAEGALRKKIIDAKLTAYDSDTVTAALVQHSQDLANQLATDIVTQQLGNTLPAAARRRQNPTPLNAQHIFTLNPANAAITLTPTAGDPQSPKA